MWRPVLTLAICLATCGPASAADLPPGWMRDDSRAAETGTVIYSTPDVDALLIVGPHEPPPATSEDAIDMPQWLRDLPSKYPATASAEALGDPKMMESGGISLHTLPFVFSHPRTGERTRALYFLVGQEDGSITQAMIQTPFGKPVAKDDLADLTNVILAESLRMVSGAPVTPATTATQKASTGGWTPVAMSHSFGRKSYDTMSGLWRFKGEAVWTHYANGWAVSNLTAPLSSVELKALKRKEPERFRKIAGDKALRSAKLMKAAKRGKTYDLALYQPSTGSTGIGTYAQTRRITLRRDGTFKTRAFAIASGGGRFVDSESGASGRYEVDGLTIALPFATDGREALVIGDEYVWKEE